MKNYNEITKNLLERRDRYVIEQKKKRKTVVGITTSLCCFCLVALIGFGMWNDGRFSVAPLDQTVEDALYPGIKDNFDESKGESHDNPAANNKILINSIEGISSERANICLLEDDFVEMSREEMIQYYGMNYFPKVPADMTAWDGGRLGIFNRNVGTGDVYWDQDVLNYSNEDHTRHINIEVAKGHIPFLDYGMFSVKDKTSVINNVELKIGLTDDGRYYSEFMYKSVGFMISAEGVTEDEFISIITSILE